MARRTLNQQRLLAGILAGGIIAALLGLIAWMLLGSKQSPRQLVIVPEAPPAATSPDLAAPPPVIPPIGIWPAAIPPHDLAVRKAVTVAEAVLPRELIPPARVIISGAHLARFDTTPCAIDEAPLPWLRDFASPTPVEIEPTILPRDPDRPRLAIVPTAELPTDSIAPKAIALHDLSAPDYAYVRQAVLPEFPSPRNLDHPDGAYVSTAFLDHKKALEESNKLTAVRAAEAAVAAERQKLLEAQTKRELQAERQRAKEANDAILAEREPPHPQGAPPAEGILCMAADPRGSIWIGTEWNGVLRYDPRTGQGGQGPFFTTADGLGDNSVFAVAVDRLGRTWVGHLNHGVSVYNGKQWKNYDVVTGPLGERIFAIKCCPTDGDVWIASSAGLARYSLSKDTWSYYTRAEGLPSDQASSLAFDPEGNLYVGTQCDGIAIAQAKDDYKTWKVIAGPDKLPTVARGEGLPTNLINDILVARDGTVYAATTAGLAESHDKGASWKFYRGMDWIEKVKLSYGGPPPGWNDDTGSGGALLAEDYVTCLAEGEDGKLWIGHRKYSYECLDEKSGTIAAVGQAVTDRDGVLYVTGIVPTGSQAFIAGYGQRFMLAGSGQPSFPAPSRAREPWPAFPSPAKAPTTQELTQAAALMGEIPKSKEIAMLLGEDWTTHGDWVGRYGRQFGLLCAGGAPADHQLSWGNAYQVNATIGPHCSKGDGLRRFVLTLEQNDPGVLYDPVVGYRRPGVWDDHGETYDWNYEGPDIWISVNVPEGVHRVSLYHLDMNKGRGSDNVIELRKWEQTTAEALRSPPLARARFREFGTGVYKQFAVSGPAKYWIRIARNTGYISYCSGVFIDRLGGPTQRTDSLPMPYMASVRYDPPSMPAGNAPGSAKFPGPMQFRPEVVFKCDSPNAVYLRRWNQLLTYRFCATMPAMTEDLERLRWNLCLWTPKDRELFQATMRAAWEDNKRIIDKQAHGSWR